MLEFINNNGVLFSGIFSIIVALISIVVTFFKEHKNNKTETIRSLKKELSKKTEELEKLNKELLEANSIKNAEKNIDKTHGAIYKEILENGQQRDICGYCWEKDHKKIPLAVVICYEEYTNQAYYDGFCQSCKTHCIENIEPDIPDEDYDNICDQNLPF